MRFSVRLFICFILLAAVLLTEKFTNADTALQNLFYRPETHEWLINPALHQKLSPVFYKGLKFLLAATGAGCLIFLLLSLKKPSLAVRRRPVLILLLSIVFVPLVVAGAKYFTNVYCPYQLNIYNGLYPFVRIIDSYPESFVQPKPGRCFPAGHATAVSPLWRCILFSTAAAEKSSDCLPAFCLAWRPDFTRCCADSTFCHIRSSA